MGDLTRQAVKLARERLRGNHPCFEEFVCIAGDKLSDLKLLAFNDLAEHPVDDDELIDAAWLDTTSLRFITDHGEPVGWWTAPNSPDRARFRIAESVCHYPGEWLATYGDCFTPRLKTRGDLRRLCKALGIPLEETP